MHGQVVNQFLTVGHIEHLLPILYEPIIARWEGRTQERQKGGEEDVTLKPEHIVEELNRTPKLKRDLIMKMMEVMLDSEAFLEAYPTLYDPRIADVDLE